MYISVLFALPMETNFGISIHEKLKSKKQITELFNTGKHVFINSIHIVWQYSLLNEDNLKFGVSVGKRNFKRAVKRNVLKRRMREAFRMNKSDLIQHLLFTNRKIEFMIIFKAKEELSFQIIEVDLQKAIAKLKNQIHTM